MDTYGTVKSFIHRYFYYIKTHPNHRVRKTIGVVLVIGGSLGFLPLLGYWMLPLGLALLAVDSPVARRLYRRLQVWWGRRVQTVYRVARGLSPKKVR